MRLPVRQGPRKAGSGFPGADWNHSETRLANIWADHSPLSPSGGHPAKALPLPAA